MTNSIADRYSVPGPARKPLAFLRTRLRFRACLGPPFTRGMVSSFRSMWSQRHSPDQLSGGMAAPGTPRRFVGRPASLNADESGRQNRAISPCHVRDCLVTARASGLLRLPGAFGLGRSGCGAPLADRRNLARADEDAHQLAQPTRMGFRDDRGLAQLAALVGRAGAHQVRRKRVVALELTGLGHPEALRDRLVGLHCFAGHAVSSIDCFARALSQQARGYASVQPGMKTPLV